MKKIQNFKSVAFLLFGMIALVLSSCSKPAENIQLIPKEAIAVSVIDVYSLAKKGKMKDFKELNLFKAFKEEVNSESKKTSKMMTSVMEDPRMTGIDFKSDVFVYYMNEDEQYFCLSMALKNEGKFESFLEEFMETSEMDYSIENENSFKYMAAAPEMTIAWDENKLMFLGGFNNDIEPLKAQLKSLFSLNSEDRITSNEDFNEFYKNKRDISAWVSTNSLMKSTIFMAIPKGLNTNLEDNYISMHLNFGDDNISLLTNYTPNEEMSKMMEEYDASKVSFNNDLFNYFPKQSYAAMSLSTNPMAYYNIMKQEEGFESVQEMFKNSTDQNLKDVLESVKGNIIVSLFGFENQESTYMTWGTGFNESNALALLKLAISEAGFLSTQERELLSQGKTIQIGSYEEKYCINIKNIIAADGTLESALANDSKINWYKGGWEFGQNMEVTTEDLVPQLAMAMDLNDSKIIDALIDKIPMDEITKNEDYYEFKIGDRYTAYLALKDETCYLTNNFKSLENFKNGGNTSENLGNSDISASIAENNGYMYLDLNFENYPSNLKNKLNGSLNEQAKKIFKLWDDLITSFEVKQIDLKTSEVILNIKNNKSNSLNTIITTMDENYKDALSL